MAATTTYQLFYFKTIRATVIKYKNFEKIVLSFLNILKYTLDNTSYIQSSRERV